MGLDFREKVHIKVYLLFLYTVNNGPKRGVLEIDGDRLVGMEEKPAQPKTQWCCPPFYYYTREDSKKIGEAIADGCGIDAPGRFIAWLLTKSPVYAMEMPGKRYDIGDIKSYEKVKEEYKGIEG